MSYFFQCGGVQGSHGHIPIVFVSGHGDVSSVAAAMRRGAVDFLVKPPDEADLMRAVGSALTRDIETRRRNSS